MRNTLSILVANEPGELSRIVGLFSARGYNIETISVGKTLEDGWSRCTIVTEGDAAIVEQILKQCARLARVREAKAVTSQPHIEREMALIDVNAVTPGDRAEIKNLVDIFRAKIVDITHDRLIIEASGNKEKVDRFIGLLESFGMNEIVRTGYVAINTLMTDDSSPSALQRAA
jgi:acetolactate synthase I/III small subunit